MIFLEQLKAGDESSYKKLFDEYYVRLCVFAKKYTHDIDVSKDLVQDLFVKLYADRKTLKINTSIQSYLYQSVKNRCLNYIRHEQINTTHLQNIKAVKIEENHQWEDKMIETELESKIFQIVTSLPKQYKRIYNMSRVEGRKNKQIADELNISIRTVETQISNALKELRIGLQSYVEMK